MTAAAVALRASVDLPATPASVSAARRVAHHLLTGWSAEPFCDDALLLLTELVSNVVRHVTGRAPLRLELSLTGLVLYVAVLDTSTTPPVPGAPTGDGGYGLQLVDALSDSWGTQDHPGGKRVWFELRRA
ncbi:MAG TPA: ATP-binding protein [Pseudonocardia sp.]|nr:ATP-binding protein [Pseudonocardia sp.]